MWDQPMTETLAIWRDNKTGLRGSIFVKQRKYLKHKACKDYSCSALRWNNFHRMPNFAMCECPVHNHVKKISVTFNGTFIIYLLTKYKMKLGFKLKK